MRKNKNKIPEPNLEVLHFKTHDGHIQILIRAIKYCHAYGPGPYADIHIDLGKKNTVCVTLKEIEEKINNDSFCRCHQSWLVNLNKADFFCSSKKIIFMKDSIKIPISRTKWDDTLIKLLLYNIQDKKFK